MSMPIDAGPRGLLRTVGQQSTGNLQCSLFGYIEALWTQCAPFTVTGSSPVVRALEALAPEAVTVLTLARRRCLALRIQKPACA